MKLFHFFIKLLLGLVSQIFSKDQCQIALVVEFSSHSMDSISHSSTNNVKFQKYRQPTAKIKMMAQEIVTNSVAMRAPAA